MSRTQNYGGKYSRVGEMISVSNRLVVAFGAASNGCLQPKADVHYLRNPGRFQRPIVVIGCSTILYRSFFYW